MIPARKPPSIECLACNNPKSYNVDSIRLFSITLDESQPIWFHFSLILALLNRARSGVPQNSQVTLHCTSELFIAQPPTLIFTIYLHSSHFQKFQNVLVSRTDQLQRPPPSETSEATPFRQNFSDGQEVERVLRWYFFSFFFVRWYIEFRMHLSLLGGT